MKRLIALLAMVFLLAGVQYVQAQGKLAEDSMALEDVEDTTAFVADSAMAVLQADLSDEDDETMEEDGGLHKQLKRKFIEGSASFMSLVALALVLGLAFCIERIIYLTLSEVDTKRLMNDVDAKLQQNDVEGAKELCRDTRGPVASICYQGLLHIKEPLEQIDRQLTNYGMVQISKMDKGCRIETAGDISPTIVAQGMKVALITTIFGIIVAIVLQFFYNYILSKIEHLTSQMEEGAIIFMDSVTQLKTRNNG